MWKPTIALLCCLAGIISVRWDEAAAQELMGAMPLSTAAPPIALSATPQAGSWVGATDWIVPPSGPSTGGPWRWQVLPAGLLYRSYLAGPREPRFASQWVHLNDGDWVWDIALGGRAGILRYGTTDPLWPEGCELDIEGAAFPRLSMDHDEDLVAADFRFGVPLTYRSGPWETKFGYYHLSSHLGDEYLEDHLEASRINYVRDAVIWGLALHPAGILRIYGEASWAFNADEGAEPWEFQVGASLSPGLPTGLGGAPFAAVNGLLREEAHFGGNLTVQAGWAWKGLDGRMLRVGLHYLNGKSNQLQFFQRYEEQIGAGIWFDY